ncbi:hypothetical protein AB6A40_010222 [Gnathostoma spinigerum]|uniref:Uncharacterized protein n=1 Tax=Gnathostoma spinigerum TaxID=75299 RepID=A0ABD6EU80_9BILA
MVHLEDSDGSEWQLRKTHLSLLQIWQFTEFERESSDNGLNNVENDEELEKILRRRRVEFGEETEDDRTKINESALLDCSLTVKRHITNNIGSFYEQKEIENQNDNTHLTDDRSEGDLTKIKLKSNDITEQLKGQ